MGKGIPALQDKGLLLNREEKDEAHRHMAVYKGKEKKEKHHVRMRCLI